MFPRSRIHQTTRGIFMSMESDNEIKRVLLLSKQAALIALQNYDLDWEQIRFNQLSETCTFVIETTKKESFLLRIHSKVNREEINSELEWLDILNEKINITLPKGILDRTGSKTVSIELENDFLVCASMMHWVEGEHPSNGLTDDQLRGEGILLAKLHEASNNVELSPNFVRPVWGEQSFRHAMTRLSRHYNRFLTDAEFKLYQAAAEKIQSWIIKLEKNEDDYGLIHGDLHQGNIVFQYGEPRPIDFGRCGYGYFLYDIAHTILGVYPVQRKVIIKGYESIKELKGDWLPALEGFTVMVMIENYCHHAPDPRETAGLKEEQPYAQAIIRNYLSGKPFLFNPIEL